MQVGVGEPPKSETHTLPCTHVWRSNLRDNSKWGTFVWCSAYFLSFWPRLQTSVDEASSAGFWNQDAPKVPVCPKQRPGPALPKGSYSFICWCFHINQGLRGVSHHKSDLSLSTFGCVHWSILREVPPQYLCNHPGCRKSRLWSSEALFGQTGTLMFDWLIRWRSAPDTFFKVGGFFAIFLAYFWLLRWRTKLKLGTCTAFK